MGAETDTGTRRLTIEEFERLPDEGSRYRSRNDVRWLTGDDELDGEPALPGFRLRLSGLFEG